MSATFKDSRTRGYDKAPARIFNRTRCGHTAKVIFPSHESAAHRGIEIMPSNFRVYRCPNCNGYHLTTKT